MRRAWLVGPLPPDDGGDGAEEDLDVLPDAVGEDVFLVEAHLLAEGDFAAAHHLPEAGDAGDDVEALAVLEGVLADFVRGWRPGADEAHVADEDIPELGELVDARAADDAADAGDAGVAPHLEDHAVGGLVPGGERGLAGLGVGAHAAELPEFEVAAVAADADLVEEDGAGAVNPDGEGDDEEKREEEDKAGGAEGDVHEALGDVGGGDGESPRLEVQAAAAVAAPVRGQLPYELVEVGVLGSVEKTFHVQADASMALAQRRRHCGVCGGGGGHQSSSWSVWRRSTRRAASAASASLAALRRAMAVSAMSLSPAARALPLTVWAMRSSGSQAEAARASAASAIFSLAEEAYSL